MEYFIMKQDIRYYPVPHIQDFNEKFHKKDFTTGSAYKISDRNVVFSDSTDHLKFIDYLESPIILISKNMKKVFSMYARNIQYKQFCILNNKVGDYGIYYAPIIDTTDRIGENCIARVKLQLKEVLVVRLDVAESLLRRNIEGILLSSFPVEFGL